MFHEFVLRLHRALVLQGNFRRSVVSMITADYENISCGIKEQVRSVQICEIFSLAKSAGNSMLLALFLTTTVTIYLIKDSLILGKINN